MREEGREAGGEREEESGQRGGYTTLLTWWGGVGLLMCIGSNSLLHHSPSPFSSAYPPCFFSTLITYLWPRYALSKKKKGGREGGRARERGQGRGGGRGGDRREREIDKKRGRKQKKVRRGYSSS